MRVAHKCRSQQHTVQVYDLDTFKVTHASKYPGPVTSLGISPDCGLLAVGQADGQLSIRKHSKPKLVPVEAGKPHCITWPPKCAASQLSSCLHAVYHVGVPHWWTTFSIASSLEDLMSQMLNVADVYVGYITQKGLKSVDHAFV